MVNSPTKKVDVRPAHPEDAETLTDLAVRAFRNTYESHNDPAIFADYLRTSLTVEKLLDELQDSANVFLVACDAESETLLGYAKLRCSKPGSGVEDTNAIEIERIYADPKAIGTGVGAALMTACLGAAADREHQTIWLGVWKPNLHAIEFYKRWQFEIVGEHMFRMGSEDQEDFIMSRAINA